MSWMDTCSRCQGTRFWPSRSGYRVCMTCCHDPFDALEILARRVPGGVARVQGWWRTLEARLDKAGREFKAST